MFSIAEGFVLPTYIHVPTEFHFGLSPSLLSFCMIFFGYIAFSSLLQYYYYFYKGKGGDTSWKIRRDILDKVGDSASNWWLPFFSILSRNTNFEKASESSSESKKRVSARREPSESLLGLHRRYATVNLLMASLFAGGTAELSRRGFNRMTFLPIILSPASHSAPFAALPMSALLWQMVAAVTYENFVEYYWHRMMHLPYFYSWLHKHHHSYTSPKPFNDMCIHPLEAFGYYCILYGPPFLFPIHFYAFLGYMVIMGLCGVLDHSGIVFEVPFLYNTRDHDRHHERFSVNYCFPFPFMDILHGTFDGVYMGKKYSC